MSLTPPAPPLPPPPDDAGAGPATTRREFAAALALTALGACVPRAATSPAAVAPAPPAPAPPPAAATAATGRAPDPVAEALVAVVTARYGADLAPAEQRASFADAVARTVELSRRLRGTPVANGVDPFSSFCPTPTAAAGERRTP